MDNVIMKAPYRARGLAALRRRLLRRRDELSRRVAHELAQRKAEPQRHVVERLERAAAAERDDVLAEIARLGTEERTMIDEALARMEQGTYGTCQACGGHIGLNRFRAIPWTRHCLNCQRKQDLIEIPRTAVRFDINNIGAHDDGSDEANMPSSLYQADPSHPSNLLESLDTGFDD